MQVFVPFPDIKQSVRALDPSRLGNQIYRECLTLARGKWPNHPVSKMWWNHTYFLCEYAFAGLVELQDRGKHYPNIFDSFHEIQMSVVDTGPPIWWGDPKVHLCHQSNLKRKDPEHYKDFQVVSTMDYYYPSLSQKEIINHGRNYQNQNSNSN